MPQLDPQLNSSFNSLAVCKREPEIKTMDWSSALRIVPDYLKGKLKSDKGSSKSKYNFQSKEFIIVFVNVKELC